MVCQSRFIIIIFIFLFSYPALAQLNPDQIIAGNIRTVRFHMYGSQDAMPVYKLNSSDRFELHFDDMDGNVKSYYYTYQLCDVNWKPVNLSAFDFIKGFTQQRISSYRLSSIAFKKYTHYQIVLPDPNALPSKSGNYLLKIFLDGDTSKTVLTRGLLVVDPKATVSAQIVQPFTPQFFRTHQRVRFNVNIEGLNTFNANRQVKVRVLQNQRWDNAIGSVSPTFIRGGTLEYNNENSFVFEGGKEWRWLDLRSYRLLSDRIESAANTSNSFNLFVKKDMDRSTQKYVYYQDQNGLYQVLSYENINPYWQADYATVNFSFVPPNNLPYSGKDLYLFGQLTDYKLNDQSKMTFNATTGQYEGSLFLKQGYYDYAYMLTDHLNQNVLLEGNNWETENNYTILVYYKDFSDQYDRLIGIGRISSRTDRPGFSF